MIRGYASACIAGLMAIPLSSSASLANDAPIPLSIVWSFPHQGIARFCYDKIPAAIYLKYDAARKITSIFKRELDGTERIFGEFPGVPNERSLSCSQNGQTTVALGDDAKGKVLFLSEGTRTSLYQFSGDWLFSNVGLYSLISPDGKSITLPEIPTLALGDGLLKEMKVLPHRLHNVFFVKDYAYVDGKDSIRKHGYVGGQWTEQQEIKRPPNFNVSEVAMCGDRDIATLVGFDSSRFAVIGQSAVEKRDWLERVGVRNLLRKYRSPALITGSYGACAFPLSVRAASPWIASGIARFNADGLQIFSFQGHKTALSDHAVYFSKDGCYVLIHVFRPTPQVPQFTMRQEVELLRVESPRCE